MRRAIRAVYIVPRVSLASSAFCPSFISRVYIYLYTGEFEVRYIQTVLLGKFGIQYRLREEYVYIRSV